MSEPLPPSNSPSDVGQSGKKRAIQDEMEHYIKEPTSENKENDDPTDLSGYKRVKLHGGNHASIDGQDTMEEPKNEALTSKGVSDRATGDLPGGETAGNKGSDKQGGIEDAQAKEDKSRLEHDGEAEGINSESTSPKWFPITMDSLDAALSFQPTDKDRDTAWFEKWFDQHWAEAVACFWLYDQDIALGLPTIGTEIVIVGVKVKLIQVSNEKAYQRQERGTIVICKSSSMRFKIGNIEEAFEAKFTRKVPVKEAEGVERKEEGEEGEEAEESEIEDEVEMEAAEDRKVASGRKSNSKAMICREL